MKAKMEERAILAVGREVEFFFERERRGRR
jgi:hypothetical protein